MGLLRRLLGSDAESLRSKADTLFEQGDYGSAKIQYERAQEAVANDQPEQRQALEARVNACRDKIAEQRLQAAEELLERQDWAFAREELEGAREVAHAVELRERAQALIDSMEQRAAVSEVAVEADMTDEDRIAILVGQWNDAQADEYDAYGEDIYSALVALHKGDAAHAHGLLEALLAAAEQPCYLWLEIGRARLGLEDAAGTATALEQFLAALGDDPGGEARLSAHLALADLADAEGHFETAIDHLQGAIDALPGNYRPYFAMGAFMRARGHAAEAIDVLKTSLEIATTHEADWRVLSELGLALRTTGQRKEAIACLQQVLDFFIGHQVTDFPVESTLALAELHEQEGNLERAADLYRSLCDGSDQESRARYHYEAGRVLKALGLDDEAHRMLTRAQALSSDVELTTKICDLL